MRNKAKDKEETVKQEIWNKYNIIEIIYPSIPAKLFKSYNGTLEDSIKNFIESYGDIDGTIYWDKDKHLIAITGTQVDKMGEHK
jgi:hypothetical protein